MYSSSGDVLCTRRVNNDDKRLNDPSGTANLFNKALSSCSFVRLEKYPREAMRDEAEETKQPVVLGRSRP